MGVGKGKREMRECIEEIVLMGGLIGVQFVYAGNSVFVSYLMSLGLTTYTLLIFTSFPTFLFLSPVAFCFERSKWPHNLTCKFINQLVFISMGGIISQFLFLKGIKLTSPAVATAMPNLAPGFIFVIAWAVGVEKVDVSCIHSKVKMMGTLLCVVGALTMSLMHSTTSLQNVQPDVIIFDKDRIVGCICLIASVFTLSSNIVLQASTLGDFPAPMSLSAVTSLVGLLITVALHLFEDGVIETGWPLISTRALMGYCLLVGVVSGACLSFNGWALKKRGPVLVSVFSPVGTLVSVFLSVFTVGDTFNLGSIAGMVIMFAGLYFVLWAKGNENFYPRHDLDPDPDPEDLVQNEFGEKKKPLLSY